MTRAQPVGRASRRRAIGASVEHLRAHLLPIAVAGVAATMALGLLAFDLWRTRQRAIGEAFHETENLVRALAAHTDSVLDLIDQRLQRAAAVFGVADLERESLQQQMAVLDDGLGVVRAYVFVDHDGTIRASTVPGDRPFDLSRRSYFLAHRGGQHVVVGPPLRNPRTDEWIFTLSRRVERGGEFAGVILASIEPRHFARIFNAIDVKANGAVSLLYRDGTVIAGAPHHDRYVGRSIAEGELFRVHVNQAAAGSAQVRASVGPPHLIVSWRTIDARPLVLAVALTVEDVLGSWWSAYAGHAVVAMLMLLGIAAITALVIRGRERQVAMLALREAQAEAQHATEVAEAKMSAKSRFLAHMSHELRTPLNAVIGYAEMMNLQLHGPLSARYAEYARDIHQAGKHLLEIIDDVLGLTRLEAGAIRIELASVELADLAQACFGMVSAQASAKEISLELKGAARIVTDPRVIRQVLLNLLANAVKFTAAGGRVRLEISEAADSARIMVTDTGIGIPEAALQHMFEPFERGDALVARRHPGTGLGLFLCRQLVTALGGTIRIESTVGIGTSVTVDVPRGTGAEPAPAPVP